jgi:hypothetical protein
MLQKCDHKFIFYTLCQNEKHKITFFIFFSYYKGEENSEFIILSTKSHDSSVGIALGYGLDNWGSRVQFLVGAGSFSLHHCVQNGSWGPPASYPMDTRGSFPGGKAAGA